MALAHGSHATKSLGCVAPATLDTAVAGYRALSGVTHVTLCRERRPPWTQVHGYPRSTATRFNSCTSYAARFTFDARPSHAHRSRCPPCSLSSPLPWLIPHPTLDTRAHAHETNPPDSPPNAATVGWLPRCRTRSLGARVCKILRCRPGLFEQVPHRHCRLGTD